MSLPLSLQQETFFGTAPVSAPNIALTLRLRGPFQRDAFQGAVTAVLRRHEGLRFRLVGSGHQTGQRIADPEETVAEPVTGDGRGAWDLAWQEHATVLNLHRDGPLRIRVHQAGPEDHIVTVTVHPAALDAWGIGVFARELQSSYLRLSAGQAPRLPGLPMTFSEHVVRQRAAGADLTGAQRSLYLGQLAAMDRLALPRQRVSGPPRLTPHQAFTLEPADFNGISGFARKAGVTVTSVFLAGFQLGLGLAAGAEIGGLSCIYFGRDETKTHGMATAMARRVPVAFTLAHSQRVGDFVRQTMRTWAAAVGHSAPPYSSARLERAAGGGARAAGGASALEPVFNLRIVPPAEADSRERDGPEAARMEWLEPPTRQPLPMWPELGGEALVALVSLAEKATVTAVYDARAIAEPIADGVFGPYRRFMRLIASGCGGDITLAEVVARAGSRVI